MRQRRKAKLKRLELAPLVIYLVWLVLSIVLWRTRWMDNNHVLTGLSLVFAALLYVLLTIIKRLPQLRMTNSRLLPAQAIQVVRLRVYWLAVLKLIFMAGFAGMSIFLLFSQVLRIIWVVLFMITFAASFVWYFLLYRKITARRAADPTQMSK